MAARHAQGRRYDSLSPFGRSERAAMRHPFHRERPIKRLSIQEKRRAGAGTTPERFSEEGFEIPYHLDISHHIW